VGTLVRILPSILAIQGIRTTRLVFHRWSTLFDVQIAQPPHPRSFFYTMDIVLTIQANLKILQLRTISFSTCSLLTLPMLCTLDVGCFQTYKHFHKLAIIKQFAICNLYMTTPISFEIFPAFESSLWRRRQLSLHGPKLAYFQWILLLF